MPTVLDFQRLRDTLLPEWTKPENASVFDPAYRAPIRKIISLLGLDDPQQVMALGTPLETGSMAGGAVEAISKRFPRFAEALKTYTTPGQPPFYSRLEESVQGMGKQVPAPKLLGVVQKGQASAEELAARRVPEFAAQYGNKPIPKEAIAAHLEANPVQLQVKTLGGKNSEEVLRNHGYFVGGIDEDAQLYHVRDRAMRRPLNQDEYDNLPDEVMTAFEHQATGGGKFQGPKYAQYQLPGGTNYRETLITLPMPEPVKGRLPEGYRTVAEREAKTFQSSHFDEPNILVHTRSNERDLPGLGHGTFLEEVQSDWHQQGKSKGYATKPDTSKWTAKSSQPHEDVNAAPTGSEEGWWNVYDPNGRRIGTVPRRGFQTAQQAIANVAEREKFQGVPDAPFKETWPDLALKHHLVEAAQNPETNWLGFTSGETQAARYDLSKQVSEINVNPVRMAGDREGKTSGWRLTAKDPSGRSNVITQDVSNLDELAHYIGKEPAKIAASQIESQGKASLTGLDLQVGGEGMKYFYDTLLPKRLEKIVKPFGGTVERGGPENGWIIRLTPEMKRRILTEGVPLMTGVAAVGAGRQEK